MSGVGTVTATVIGEALVDIIEGSGKKVVTPGGSPLNVAVGLARLDIDTRLVSTLGDDEHGVLVRRHVESAGVHTEGVQEDAIGTSVAHASLRDDGSADYHFDIRWQLAAPDLHPRDVLHVGSIGSWFEPGAEVVNSAIRTRPAGTVASFDPNIRPALCRDRASVARRVDDLCENVDIVKLSDEDAEWLYPGVAHDVVTSRLIARGASVVAITLGSRGSIVSTPRFSIVVPGMAVEVRDTVGAGDAYMSGLLFALSSVGALDRLAALDEREVTKVATIATASAAATVTRDGADPPSRARLRAWLGESSESSSDTQSARRS